jgi:hypothetical protein
MKHGLEKNCIRREKIKTSLHACNELQSARGFISFITFYILYFRLYSPKVINVSHNFYYFYSANLFLFNIIICRGCAWLIDGFCVGWIEFIGTLYTPLGTTGNYRAIDDLHTLHFTVTHTPGFSVITSRIPATDSWQSQCNCSTLWSLCTV